MIFTRLASPKRTSSTLALALALATGSMLATTVVEAPAAAQKKKKKEAPQAAQAQYSKGFSALYPDLAKKFNEGAAPTELTAAVPALLAAVETEDDRHAAGQLVYGIGTKADDSALQMQGLDMQISSGKVSADDMGRFQFAGYQLALQNEDMEKARKYLEGLAAADYAYTANLTDGSQRTFRADDYRLMAFETFVDENQEARGLAYLSDLIDQRLAAGETVSDSWIKRGLTVARDAELDAQTDHFATLYVTQYPSDVAWSDAVALVYNRGGLEPDGVLDLLRLGRRVNALQNTLMYGEYIDSADPRKFPQEVLTLIDEGYTAGTLDRSDPYLAESRAEAERRVEVDKKDLPALAADARKSGAPLRTVMAAGDAYLSYGRGAEAEEFYTKALGMAGVNTPLVYTRLGIAQLDQGKHAEAEATFNKVEGARKAIANLWRIYSNQQAGA